MNGNFIKESIAWSISISGMAESLIKVTQKQTKNHYFKLIQWVTILKIISGHTFSVFDYQTSEQESITLCAFKRPEIHPRGIFICQVHRP